MEPPVEVTYSRVLHLLLGSLAPFSVLSREAQQSDGRTWILEGDFRVTRMR